MAHGKTQLVEELSYNHMLGKPSHKLYMSRITCALAQMVSIYCEVTVITLSSSLDFLRRRPGSSAGGSRFGSLDTTPGGKCHGQLTRPACPDQGRPGSALLSSWKSSTTVLSSSCSAFGVLLARVRTSVEHFIGSEADSRCPIDSVPSGTRLLSTPALS
ncbi:hypothetical protein LSTR_LSTR007063 [Laodelphax striatellus]|uniref:Uncharacterized protein n=1 Tax=Laodelphax striatellus TaxID=195883 RepID=A0A482WJI1_LAOST|nr:hypothetical protein LSTR_LSTR007063 [Laodelphax striatellus]